MKFKEEEFVERETEIASYLVQSLSLKTIAEKIGLSKKIITAHVKNMMEKLKAKDVEALIKLLKQNKL